jgi:hypothetical protein
MVIRSSVSAMGLGNCCFPITAAHVAYYYLRPRSLPAPWEFEVKYLMALSCMLERRLISSHPF